MARAHVITMGCRLNAYEAQAIRTGLDAESIDDVVVVNTCAVTGEAVRQSRQAVRRAHRDNAGARVVATGCAAQIEPETFAEIDGVDLVLGNDEKLDAARYRVRAGTDTGAARVEVADIMTTKTVSNPMVDGFAGRARAFVQVQTGCDHRCTFCVIPYGRGNSRSVPVSDVVEQIQRLCDGGQREVVLTGVDITSYGADLDGAPTLGHLVCAILTRVPDLERLRLSSLDMIEIDSDLLDALESDPRMMPHLHLSVQAGDDMILKRMKRRHSRDDVIGFCDEVRRRRPDVVFGADMIAGFPTETEAMFDNSLALLDDCGLTYLHAFPFSPRPGTPAARMPQVAPGLVRDRAARLRSRASLRLDDYLSGLVGTTVDVAVESDRLGRTPHYAQVVLDRNAAPGAVCQATVTGYGNGQAQARICA